MIAERGPNVAIPLDDPDIRAYSQWDTVKRRLLRERRRLGTFTVTSISTGAADLGIGVRTLWRWLEIGGPPTHHRFELTERHLILIAVHKRLKLAWKAAAKEGLAADYTTFWRAWQREPQAVRVGILKGVKAMRVEQVYGKYPHRQRNGVWQADHTKLPIWIRPKKGKAPVRAWLTAFIDVGTKVVVSWAVTDRQPNAEVVIATLVDGIIGETLPDGTFIGGKPRTSRFDRGADFQAKLVAAASKVLGIIPRPCDPFEPAQKPQVERLMGIVCFEFLPGLPGIGAVLDHRQKLAFRERPETLLTFDEFVAVIRARFAWYNSERPHTSLGGRTPFAAWRDETTPIELVAEDATELGIALIRREETRTVNQSGIHLGNVDYTNAALTPYRRKKVQIGYVQHDPTFVWTYIDGKPICRAVPADHLSLEQVQALRKTRTREITTVRSIRLGATKMSEANGTRDPDDGPLAPPSRPPRGPRSISAELADSLLDDTFGDPLQDSEFMRDE